MNYNDDVKYEQDRLEAGKYELFIKDMFLNEFKIVLNMFESREFQHKVGETVQGVEIKYDKKFSETGNLFIEVAHKKTMELGMIVEFLKMIIVGYMLWAIMNMLIFFQKDT